MALESYCASCTWMNTNPDCGKFYCTRKGEWKKANSPKCGSYMQAHTRDTGTRENMYDYSSRYYITTAILSILKALDNNFQIQALGEFIENTMRKDLQYLPLLYAYEIIGPQVAEKLKQDKNKTQIAISMFYQYIKPTIKLIQEGKTELAIETYKTMTLELAKKYNVNTNIVLPMTPQELEINNTKQVFTRKRVYSKPRIIPANL